MRKKIDPRPRDIGGMDEGERGGRRPLGLMMYRDEMTHVEWIRGGGRSLWMGRQADRG